MAGAPWRPGTRDARPPPPPVPGRPGRNKLRQGVNANAFFVVFAFFLFLCFFFQFLILAKLLAVFSPRPRRDSVGIPGTHEGRRRRREELRPVAGSPTTAVGSLAFAAPPPALTPLCI